jgi:hypothetical protein
MATRCDARCRAQTLTVSRLARVRPGSVDRQVLDPPYAAIDPGDGRSSSVEPDEADPYATAQITGNRLPDDRRLVDLPTP